MYVAERYLWYKALRKVAKFHICLTPILAIYLGLFTGTVSTLVKHKKPSKDKMDPPLQQLLDVEEMKGSHIANLSLFLSVLQVVDATSPAQADAGDPQRITARPVSM